MAVFTASPENKKRREENPWWQPLFTAMSYIRNKGEIC